MKKTNFTEKDITKLSKGKIHTRYFVLFLCIAFFVCFAGLVGIVYGAVTVPITWLIVLGAVVFVIGLTIIGFVFTKKTYSKKLIDALNKQLFNEGFGTIEVANNEKSLVKTILKDLKTENVTVEKIDGSTAVNILGKKTLLIDVKESTPESNKQAAFQGTVVIINDVKLNLMDQVEIREKKTNISKSYRYGSAIEKLSKIINGEYNVYSANPDDFEKVNIPGLQDVLSDIKSEKIVEICMVFSQNRVILEFYDYHISSSFIPYIDIYPGKRYLEKLEKYQKVNKLIREVIKLLESAK